MMLRTTNHRLAGALASAALLLAIGGCSAASPSVMPSAQSASHSATEPPSTPAPTATPSVAAEVVLALAEGPEFDDYLSGTGQHADQGLRRLGDRLRERRGPTTG